MIALSNRLKTIAHKIDKNSRIADIGSDHALLPVYLAKQGIVSFAIAGEFNAGPLDAAKRQVEQAQCQHMIEVRGGDGLAVIQSGEVDAITIAGMGGGLITRILNEGKHKLDGVRKLVLQPNVGEDLVRHWLYEHDWYLLEEDILLEDHKIYEILHAVKVENAAEMNRDLYHYDISSGLLTRDDLFRFGPYLLREPSTVFFNKWELEIEKLGKVCSKLAQSSLKESKQRLKLFQDDIAKLKEVLHCLQKGKPSYNGLNN